MSSGRLTDNGQHARAAKREMRERVLEEIAPAHVLDVFCGATGEMHAAVWHRAASYIGCDKEWRKSDTRRRFVGDSLLLLRAIDLAPFNVFDLDAYGSPWEAMQILAARRTWKPGERGAVIFTDGSEGKTKFGSCASLASMVGSAIYHKNLRAPMRDAALTAWTRRARVTPVRIWRARGYSGAVGSIQMTYCAIVFDGATAERAARPDAASPA